MRPRSEGRVPPAQTMKFPAPTGGWVQSGNITNAPPNQCEQLDNFFPTAQGAELRGGSSEYADMGATVKRLWNHFAGATESMFGSTATSIFDVDRLAGGSNTWAEVEGLSSGDWSVAQQSTSGGVFSVWVNGADYALYYDGSNINPITTAAVNNLEFDSETAAFAVGETVTGGTSSATATILAITKTSATAGALKVGTITGTFQDNETITDGATGSATSNIPSGTSAASAITLTGVATTALSQVWLFKERLFFVEKDTQSAWYLPVESIGGAATELTLGSIFRKGGNLLFGATWSLDAGSGLDDVCVFVSAQGEIAVYEGTDPSSANTWSLVGVYEIADPIDKHAFFKAGGDLAILTDDGIIPVSEALRKDRAALQATAITYPIEDAWREVVAQRTSSDPITATLWQSKTQLLVGTPATEGGLDVCFVANARTGAWARYTGWDVQCSTISGDELYFGTSLGKVVKAETGGQDVANDGRTGTTNLITYSQDFTDSSWATLNAATLAIDATGPDGTTSAVTLVDNSGGGTGQLYIQSADLTVSTSTNYTMSCYFKADGLNWVRLGAHLFTSSAQVWFDLSTGSAGTTTGTELVNYAIEDVGSGWYRCSVTFTSDSSDTVGKIRISVGSADANTTVDLDGTSSILIYGAQFEEGSTVTTYVATEGAAVTYIPPVSYTGSYVPKFTEGGNSNYKMATHAGLTYRAAERLTLRADGHGDYNITGLTAPLPSPVSEGSVWGTGVWGTFIWGGTSTTKTYVEQQAISAGGYSLAPSWQITSNTTAKVNFEILGSQMRYETGFAL